MSKTSRPVADAFRLKQKSLRRELGQFLVEGPQAIEYAVRVKAPIRTVFVDETQLDDYARLLAALPLDAEIVTGPAAVIDKLADTRNPRGIIAVADWIQPLLDLTQVHLIVALEQASDPGNLGTIIRTADAAGAQAVILGPQSVDPTNAKVVRASAGSIFGIRIHETPDLAATIEQAKDCGIKVLGTHLHATVSLFDSRLTQQLAGPVMWVFGNEAHGLSDATAQLCDELVSIPIFGHAESLNLASASAICLYASAARLQAQIES